jgi:Flp pilus assembly protein TadD
MSRPILLACAATVALSGCASIGKLAGATPNGTSDAKTAELKKPDAFTQKDVDARANKGVETKAEDRKTSAKAIKDGKKVDLAARAAIEREDVLAQMTFWAGEYATFPGDSEAARKFADVLRRAGRADRAVEVASAALERTPNDHALIRTYGLSLLAAGRSGEAVRPLAIVAQSDPKDWRTRSSLGVALDEQGRYEAARQAYKEALAIKPDDPGVLTNLGVSYIMVGEAKEAEAILKQAAALPDATPETRQNLSLAVGLQGRFDEAEQLQKVDLPPAIVASNMSFIRGLITDDRRWGDLKKSLQ